MMMMMAANRLHRIFVTRHGFTNPPVNPKIVFDASFCEATSAHGGTTVSFVTGLVGPARFYTTRCVAEQVPEDDLPPDLKLIYCLHPPRDNNPEACLRLVFASVNPKDYIFATVQNTDLANSVQALPMISLSDGGHPAVAVYRPPSASQIQYADTHTAEAIGERKRDDLQWLKNKKKRLKRKTRRNAR